MHRASGSPPSAPAGDAGPPHESRPEADGYPIVRILEAFDRGQRAGGRAASHIAALFAAGALVFYAIGVVRRAAALHAEGVPLGRGIPLQPLQDYLVAGLSVVIEPENLLAVFFFGVLVLYWSRFMVARVAREVSRAEADRRRIDPADSFALIGGIAILVLVPVVSWLPMVVLVCALLAALYLQERLTSEHRRSPGEWIKRAWQTPPPDALTARQGALRALLTTATVLYIILQSWFMPPTLDRIKLTLTSDEVVQGRVVAQANAAVYIVGHRAAREHGGTSMRAIPQARIRILEISDATPRRYKTLAQMLGLGFT